MNIALIGTTAQAALQFRADLIKNLRSKNHSVFVFCNDYTPETKAQIEALGGLPIDSPLSRAGNRPLHDILAVVKLRRLLKERSIECVLSYFAKPAVFGTLAAKYAGIQNRCVMLEGLGWAFTQRPSKQGEGFNLLRTIQMTLFRLALPVAKSVIFLNEDDLKTLRDDARITMKHTAVLGAIGVPQDFFETTPPPSNPVTFIFVGRLLFDKGIREFIGAAKIIKQKYPHTVFKIYGDIDQGNPRSLKPEDVAAIKKENIIDLNAFTPDIKPALKAASCLVLPSYREGFPRTVQEAMAMSRPVIVADVPGCKHAVQNAKTGLIAAPFSPESLAQKMQTLIENPAAIIEIGQAAHEYARENFDGKKQAEKLSALMIQ